MSGAAAAVGCLLVLVCCWSPAGSLLLLGWPLAAAVAAFATVCPSTLTTFRAAPAAVT